MAADADSFDFRPCRSDDAILFHPNLIYGTPLAKRIYDYTFFDCTQHEALHLSAQRYIQNKIIDLSKQYVMDKKPTINQVD
ncbi:MAG: hypothetical protein LKK12_02630 [Bacteroidales bacterium]|nr:hypothetical protein [Bacteroidales bacterium]MCI2133261.1 hypothetical protein [Bacteroidales bacterium]